MIYVMKSARNSKSLDLRSQGRRGDLGEVQTVLESEAAAHRMVEFPGAPADGAGAQAPHQPGARKTHWREHPWVRESGDCARSLWRKGSIGQFLGLEKASPLQPLPILRKSKGDHWKKKIGGAGPFFL